MSEKETLEKAVQKAIDNGWHWTSFNDLYIWNKERSVFIIKGLGERDLEQQDFSLFDIIYDHSFAKSIWGEGNIKPSNGSFKRNWKFHVQQMVVTENPIKYLGENL